MAYSIDKVTPLSQGRRNMPAADSEAEEIFEKFLPLRQGTSAG
jgi:hypothetical protein